MPVVLRDWPLGFGMPGTPEHGLDNRCEIACLEGWVMLSADGCQDVGFQEAAVSLHHESVDFPLNDPCHRFKACRPRFRGA